MNRTIKTLRTCASAAALAALCVPALAPVAPAMAQQAGSLDQVVAALRGITTLKANFTQTDRSGQSVSGVLTMKRPGRIRFQYQKGVPMLIVGDGKALTLVDYEVKQVQRWPIGNSPLGAILDPKRDVRSAGTLKPTGNPNVVSVEVRDRRLHRFPQHLGVRRGGVDEPLLHPLIEQRAGDIAVELVIGATPSSASGSSFFSIAAVLLMSPVMLATIKAFGAPTAETGSSRLAEEKIALARPISTSTTASPVIPTRTRCIAWAESCCGLDFIPVA